MIRSRPLSIRFAILGLLGALAFAAAAGPGADPAVADHRDQLLAPGKVCPKQTNRSLSIKRQLRIMRCMHNFARKKKGRKPLRKRGKLQWSATQKTREILECQDFSHDACGRDAFYWIRRTGFMSGCYGVNENISYGSGWKGSVRNVMSGWLHSDGHRRALLTRRHRFIGIGLARGSYQGYDGVQSWTAHFGYRC